MNSNEGQIFPEEMIISVSQKMSSVWLPSTIQIRSLVFKQLSKYAELASFRSV